MVLDLCRGSHEQYIVDIEIEGENFALVPITFPLNVEEFVVVRMNRDVVKSVLDIERHNQLLGGGRIYSHTVEILSY